MRAGCTCCSSSCPATMFSFKELLAGYTEKHIYRHFMRALDYVDSLPGSLGSRLAALADFAECVCCWECLRVAKSPLGNWRMIKSLDACRH